MLRQLLLLLPRHHRLRRQRAKLLLERPEAVAVGRRAAERAHALPRVVERADALARRAVRLEAPRVDLGRVDLGVGCRLARVFARPPAQQPHRQPRPLVPVLADVPRVALRALEVGERHVNQLAAAVEDGGGVDGEAHAAEQRVEAQHLQALRGRGARVGEPLVRDGDDARVGRVGGHRAALRVARGRVPAVDRHVVGGARGDILRVRRRHRVLGHVGENRLELRLERVVVGGLELRHTEQREQRHNARERDRARHDGAVELRVQLVVVAVQRRRREQRRQLAAPLADKAPRRARRHLVRGSLGEAQVPAARAAELLLHVLCQPAALHQSHRLRRTHTVAARRELSGALALGQPQQHWEADARQPAILPQDRCFVRRRHLRHVRQLLRLRSRLFCHTLDIHGGQVAQSLGLRLGTIWKLLVPLDVHACGLQQLVQHRTDALVQRALLDAVRLGDGRVQPQPAKERVLVARDAQAMSRGHTLQWSASEGRARRLPMSARRCVHFSH